MTAVNVTTDGKTTVVENTTTNTVSITTAGPQGPAASGFVFDGSRYVVDLPVCYRWHPFRDRVHYKGSYYQKIEGHKKVENYGSSH